ncbi:MAG: helix-turn-helix transcriptional regulator [Methanomicrobia archaeon]|nr:helix-turn-helix transcriptional regulator [Methanomicrobia archaeon]
MIYVEEKEKNEYESLEQEVFKALDHQKRRDILRYIGERKGITFTEIMKAGKIPDTPTLSYHLKTLSPFIEQRNGKYHLTPIGKDAYNLLHRTTTYDKLALFQKNKYEVTVGNTILWITAIAAAVYLEADTVLTTIFLPGLAAVSLTITYQLFK